MHFNHWKIGSELLVDLPGYLLPFGWCPLGLILDFSDFVRRNFVIDFVNSIFLLLAYKII